MAAFLAAPFADEQFWGAPTLGGPDIRAGLGSSFAALAVAVLTVPTFTALVVETPLLALARTATRRRELASAGFLVAFAGGLVAASSSSSLQLALGLSLAAPSAGCALALLQAAQMDADPHRRERWMTRWTLAGSLGDLCAPVLLAALLSFGLGWRAALALVSVPFLLLAVAVRRVPGAVFTAGEDGDEPSLRAAARRALSTPRLLAWTLGTQLCDLLDEIVVIFSALHLRETLGATPAETAVAMALLPAGSSLGLVLTDRLLRTVRPMTLVALSAVPTAALIAAFATAPGPRSGIVALALLGITCAPLYPVARATAYRTLPEDSIAVAAVDSLLTPVGMALPLVVALVADVWGLRAAVLVLMAQPLGLLLLALLPSARPPSGDPPP